MKKIHTSAVIIIVLLIGVSLFLLYSNKKATTNEPALGADSILSETHRIDKKINNGDITWVGIDVKRNDKDGTSNYELWRFDKNKKQPLLIDNFWLSTPYSSIEWNLNGKKGLNVKTTIAGGDAGTTTDIVYDSEGIEQLRIVKESNQDFTFQQKQRGKVEVSSLIEGACKGPAPVSPKKGYVIPQVTLKGVRLTLPYVENNIQNFAFAEPKKVDCVSFDGSLMNPGMKISQFNDESIELTLSNGQKSKIILKPFPGYAEVSF